MRTPAAPPARDRAPTCNPNFVTSLQKPGPRTTATTTTSILHHATTAPSPADSAPPLPAPPKATQ
eukprot:5654855-Prymnesium_polylepis.1